MATQRLLFRGAMDLGDGPVQVEVWAGATSVVTFGDARRVLTGAMWGLTDDNRLRITGTGEDGALAEWVGAEPARVATRWHNARVAWPDGVTWSNAQVSATQYGVRVAASNGQQPVDLAAATLAVVGQQRWIVDGDQWIAASSGHCGTCTGSRAR